MLTPWVDVAVNVILYGGVEPFGDPLAVLDYNGLDAIQSYARHKRVRALQPFRVFAVVLDEPGGQLLGRLRVIDGDQQVALSDMSACRAADVDLPAAAVDRNNPDVLDIRLGAVAGAAGH